jgi:hypothetical protein
LELQKEKNNNNLELINYVQEVNVKKIFVCQAGTWDINVMSTISGMPTKQKDYPTSHIFLDI